MRTANYRDDLIAGIAALLSINPNPDLSPEFASQFTQFINTRINYAWSLFDWSELMVTEERAYRPIWRSDQDYFPGDQVYFLPNTSYYGCILETPEETEGSLTYSPTGTQGLTYWVPLSQTAQFNDGVSNGTTTWTSATANFNNGDLTQTFTGPTVPAGTTIATVNSATSVTLSQATTGSGTSLTFTIGGRTSGLDKYIAYDQLGQRPIGEVYGVYNFNPRLYPSLQPPGLSFRQSEKGIDVLPFTGNSAFVYYKLVPSQFTSATFVSGTVYQYGNKVYWTDGNCYQCVAGSTTNDPTDYASWSVIPLPLFLVNYVKTAAAADAADDSRTEQTLLGEADLYLEQQIDMAMAQGKVHRYNLRAQQKAWIPYGVSGFWWSVSAPWSGGFVSTLTDALYNPTLPDRRPSLVTDTPENIVDDTGAAIVTA